MKAITRIFISCLMPLLLGQSILAMQSARVPLKGSTLWVDPSEPTYVQYGGKDLAGYLSEITGEKIEVSSSGGGKKKAQTVIAVGKAAASAVGADPGTTGDLGEEGFVIRSVEKGGTTVIVVAGETPHGTNAGIATLLQKIRAEGKEAYLEGPLDLRSKPSFARRGIHLNGWPLNYPYAFRAWKEDDWKRFVDIAWAQRVNLLYVWPFMEILPIPLSKEDEAYLEEVKRVVEYAQKERGMEVWIMQSANRIGVSDCGVKDPRMRTYWVNTCQKDMNPADGEQFANIEKSFEALYRIVNNADGFCLIDSDPGGWPQSPLSDQLKIFQMARKLLDRYNQHTTKTKLIDWMHVGWGRHKFFSSTDAVVASYDWTDKNPDASDVAFMASTILNFKQHLSEPWWLIAGQPPYLDPVQEAGVLSKTVYLPYGAIESEPAFPLTNLGLEPVRRVFDRAMKFPTLQGVMGNNQLMLLQFPRTYYFFRSAWDTTYLNISENEMLRDLGTQLTQDHATVLANCFLMLRSNDPDEIKGALMQLHDVAQKGPAHAGAIGRFLFPDSLSVARNLELQLEIRLARQSLLKELRGKPDPAACARLVEAYFDKLLAWNKETGWDKMIDIGVWPHPIYESDKDLTEGLARLKQMIGAGAPYTSYGKIETFFQPISQHLLQKYGQDSVMVGCIEPFKLAVIESQ